MAVLSSEKTGKVFDRARFATYANPGERLRVVDTWRAPGAAHTLSPLSVSFADEDPGSLFTIFVTISTVSKIRRSLIPKITSIHVSNEYSCWH